MTRKKVNFLWSWLTDWNKLFFPHFSIKETEYLIFFRCKIDFYFTEWTPKAVFSRVAKPQVKIPLLVFMSEIKINLTPKKSNILYITTFPVVIKCFESLLQCLHLRSTAVILFHNDPSSYKVFWVSITRFPVVIKSCESLSQRLQ